MYRFRLMLLTAFVTGMIAGCGENQPNSPAQPSEVTADFAKSTADRMKAANASIDPKKAKLPPSPPSK
jgi:hypothetical protein